MPGVEEPANRGPPVHRPTTERKVTAVVGIRGGFMVRVLSANRPDGGVLGLWPLSCYCPACREKDYNNCEKMATVGKGTKMEIVRLDAAAYRERLKRNREQGLVLAKELEALLPSGEEERDMGGPLFAMRRSTTEDDNYSFSFDLGRMTGPVEVLQKRESSIFKDKKGKAIQLKAGTSVVMVKFFERDAVCPNHFIFDGREDCGTWGLVDIKAIVASNIEAEPQQRVVRTRRRAAAEQSNQWKNDKVVLSPSTVASVIKQQTEFEQRVGRWLKKMPQQQQAASAAAAAAAHQGGGGGSGS